MINLIRIQNYKNIHNLEITLSHLNVFIGRKEAGAKEAVILLGAINEAARNNRMSFNTAPSKTTSSIGVLFEGKSKFCKIHIDSSSLLPTFSIQSNEDTAQSLLSCINKLQVLIEPENGVYPHDFEKLIEPIEQNALQGNRQTVIHTNSPILLNYIAAEFIWYFYQDESRQVNAWKAFEGHLSSYLSFMDCGEIWINVEEEELKEIK